MAKRILIVEPDEISEDLYKGLFKKIGSDFLIFYSKRENKEKIKKELSDNSIDTLITEIRVPSADIPEMILEIKKENPLLKIIIVSTYKKEKFQEEFPKCIVEEYIMKPLQTKEFLQKVMGL